MSGYVVIQTDFGSVSGAMTGVCKIADPSLQVFHITGKIPKFDVQAAGASLADVLPFWPEGTVFVSVVDPGVGTERKACAARTGNGYYIVTPDNGCLDAVDKAFHITSVREIDQSVNRYRGNRWSQKSDIFHGRDVFAWCAARLAAGIIDFEGVGEEYPVSEIVRI